MNRDDKNQAKLWLRQQQRRVRAQILPLIVMTCVDSMIGVVMAALIAWVITAAIGGVDVHVTSCILAFAALAVARALLSYSREIAAHRCGARARQNLRQYVMRAISSEGPQLLRRRHSAEISAMVVDHIEAMDGYFARYLPIKASWRITPIIVLGAVAYVKPAAALILLVSAFIAVIAQAVFGIWTGVEARKQFIAMLRLQTRFLDRTRGIATLVLAGAVPHEAAQLQISGNALRQRTMRVLRTAFLSSTATDLASVIALVSVVVIHSGQIHHMLARPGHYSYDIFSVFFTIICVPEFYSSFRAKGLAYQDVAQAEAAAAELARLPSLETPPDALTVETPQTVTLGFHDVSYRWRSDRPRIIDSLNFDVAPGEILVTDGPSGAGKSTIMELILGFIVPEAGRITFNGVDATEISAEARARMIGWIDQKPVIFAGTLRDSILFAKQDATEEALLQSVKRAALEPVIRQLPHGLDTMMGEGGYGLSGGQAQRVAIARAFLKNAPILLLDEPTAHLDPESEQDIIDAIAALAVGRTVILASHAEKVRALATQKLTLGRGRASS
ncbi:ATP-binding cassette domain-containing protein [Candidatus Kirkpatrickella diaphorinae]|uniref:ATP-binding cassette domain-containing protein n=1 Tax=Candidatus Kirkpatrickella diaphorinae TaxID=2984322 RepID=A0ABY6GJV6_9PROT|nr:ATP-binding cassette domain-containing protein [Candidatus Kirkpatrickella diaphorinae]UYH51814.1 ATP-binding cassette domain-containing protein [Candidatus Kirkpatrickella diaphorinae]